MKVRKTLLVTAAGWAGLAAHSAAQVPGIGAPAAVPPVAAPLGTPVAAAAPAAPPTTIWQKLGISKEQKKACKAELCATPIGQLMSNAVLPFAAISGGMIKPCCPTYPTAAQLADPGAEGAAAAIQADEAGAKARRAAVRYLGTVDCHYWPEAEGALIAALREDHNECVRWEAALALGRGCCCTKKTIEALCIVVSCSDRDGAPKETSHRVHEAAAAALDHCLSCYAKVSTAPVQGEKPIERGPAPAETIPPPATTPPAPDTSAAKPISPGEAKAAPSMTPVVQPTVPAVVQRPVGKAYYARVAKAPIVAVLGEARRVAERYHSTPVVADTPFQGQGSSIATLMSYATGPDTQAVIPAGMSIPAGEMRAEVVSAKPANLWDLLNTPSGEGQVATSKVETVYVPPPPPKSVVVVKREPVVVKPEVVVKRETVVVAPAPAPMPNPMPEPAPMPMPKGQPLTLDFPPPTIDAPLPNIPGEGKVVEMPPAGPTPYYPTAATPTKSKAPTESATSAVSSYHPTAATPTPKTYTSEPTASVVSSYHPTAATRPTNITSEAYDATVSSYHPTAATPTSSASTQVANASMGTSPYNMALPATPTKPTVVAKSTPAPLPIPSPMPSTPASAMPMPVPAAMVVPVTNSTKAMPAAPANYEIIDHLLKTAKGDAPVEVRKASIQELAKMKVNTPEVMVALDGLSDDPVPAVRAEAIIAAARLRMGQ